MGSVIGLFKNTSSSLQPSKGPFRLFVLLRLARLKWWINSFRFVVFSSRYFILPAVLFNMALIGMMVASSLSIASLTVSQPEIENILVAGLIDIIALIVGSTVLLWGLGAWLLQLTIFCRAYLKFDPKVVLPEPGVLKEMYLTAHNDVTRCKLPLARFWLITTLFASPSCVLFVVCVILKIASMPDIFGTQAITLPPYVVQIADLGMIGLGLFIVAYSVVALATGSHDVSRPMDAAFKALLLTFKFAPVLVVLIGVIAMINLFVATPQKILLLGRGEPILSMRIDLWPSVLSQLWQGITSVVVWPFSMTFICEMLREVLE